MNEHSSASKDQIKVEMAQVEGVGNSENRIFHQFDKFFRHCAPKFQ